MQKDYDEFPPTYQPQQNAQRPKAAGAKQIGRGQLPREYRNSRAELPAAEYVKEQAEDPAGDYQAAQSENFPPAYPPSFAPAQQRLPQNQNVMPPSFAPQENGQMHLAATTFGENQAKAVHAPQQQEPGDAKPARKRGKKRIITAVIAALTTFIFVLGGWGIYLYTYGTSRMHQIAALSPQASSTPGTTYLIAGSDQRNSQVADDTPGQRADTIMLLHLPQTGTPALISIPRDTYVEIPGHGGNKINASFALGGAPLLVQTVEQLTGLGVDHYIEIGMDGVVELADAVGGVHLCYDRDVSDPYSELTWSAGCHDVDGATALAFSRMRYQDPEGDIGRANRQRQVVSQVLAKAISWETVFNPVRQKRLVGAGANILTVDAQDSLWDVGMSAFALQKATSAGGVTGTPPIAKLNYRARGMSGAAVLLDPQRITEFWQDLRDGKLSSEKYETINESQ